ncbi:hypothetical protein KY361_04260 [Candidatus Woesearchaeota archaeon]|nr:hypothetical protein [Candidatus Woesearchaeota archaeon]
MEHYDVIIVGGGIAGTTLCKDLSEICPKKSVLLIDKKSVGSNEGYGIRGTYEETIKRYKLPYFHKYKRLEVGAYDEVYFTVEDDIYLLDYKKICLDRLEYSNTEFRIEEARDVNKNSLITNKSKYNFKYLIDCSGSSFFLRKHFNMPLPFMYWLVDSKVLKKNFNLDDVKISDKSCYFFLSDTDFVEDVYPLKNVVLEGEWSYTREYKFSKIKAHDRTILKKIPNPKIIERNYTSVPISPVLPLTFKNYAFLGDSFGIANPNVGVGIDAISDSSIFLINAIKKNNLNLFEKKWKEKYLDAFTKCLASKLDRYHNNNFVKRIKSYPELSKVIKTLGKCPSFYHSLLKNEVDVKIPEELRQIFPKRSILFQLYYYILLKIKYLKMELIWG